MLNIKPIIAVGAMSGTSLDGIDVAQVTTDGRDIFEFGPSSYQSYTPSERQILEAALGLWAHETPEAVKEMIETLHARVLAPYSKAELIGFHGQTLAHDPKSGRTHQCGNGAVLAHVLNKSVIWDFRSSDVELGGQGAPLAPFFHFALAKWLKEKEPVAFLNLGGVANVSWIDPLKSEPHDEGALLAFDTGPANAPINDLMRARCGLPYDHNGELAAQGKVDQTALDDFMQHPYFFIIPPKSLDRNSFHKILDMVQHLNQADAAATLCAMSAAAIGQSFKYLPAMPKKVYLCGGGRKNASLLAAIERAISTPITLVDEVGLDGDMLEAQAFAYLAVRVLNGLPTSAPSTTGVNVPVAGGIVSRPAL